jgi:16S rRNA (adenine1518-N6/adenine1519-N6)-dimethyltransferase
MSTTSVTAILRRHGIRPKKRLGQHFLAQMPTIRKIVDAIDPSEDECVLEIGPGPGIMTKLLVERAGFVIAVDKDALIIDVAREELGNPQNAYFIEGDVLELELEEAISELSERFAKKIKVAGNLPYNISSPILFWILDHRDLISRAIVMVQKEVALRIAAAPGGKDYGTLSVRTQAYASARRLFDVSPSNFIPPPEVNSSVVEIDFAGGAPTKPEDDAAFEAVVRAAFGKRRKTIRNALLGSALGLKPDVLDVALSNSEIDGKRRPETLTVDEFIRLAADLKKLKD